MNHYEFEKPNPLKNDMKKKFNDNVEFSKEFIDEVNTEKKLMRENSNVDDAFLSSKKKKK